MKKKDEKKTSKKRAKFQSGEQDYMKKDLAEEVRAETRIGLMEPLWE